jgi:PKHD-type hydroxylase
VVYPATSLHCVEPVTRGTRQAAVFWVESMVRDEGRRRILFDLDVAINQLKQRSADWPEITRLTSCYHNLMRMWAGD